VPASYRVGTGRWESTSSGGTAVQLSIAGMGSLHGRAGHAEMGRLPTSHRSSFGRVLVCIALLGLVGASCAYDRRATPTTEATSPPEERDADSPEGEFAWVRLPGLPSPRSELAALYHEGKIYAAGGLEPGPDGSGRVSDAFEVFDTNTNEWRKLAPLPEPRHHPALAALGGVVYLIGGFTDAAFRPSEKVFAYDIASGKWSEAPPLPEPLGAGGAATLEETVYFVGGVDASGKVSRRLYALQGSKWMRKQDMPTAREHLAVASTGAFLYALGGRPPITDAAERYDPDTDSWESIAPKPTARGGIAGAGVGGRFACAAGGEDSVATYADVECYDEQDGVWRRLPQMPTARHGVGAAGSEKSFYVVGGGDRPGMSATAAFEQLQIQ
jgi:N-acetylneuraminic acid mutarotase